jgi:hypothetical protein
VLILAAVALVAFAASLTIIGWRGRIVDDHPICRRCGFDLAGLTAPGTCPECGRDLRTPHSTRIGHRRRRRVPLTIGLLLLGLLMGGLATLGIAAARGYDFNTVMPSWLLELKGQSTDAATANGALTELSRRIASGSLSREETDRLIKLGLEYQANTAAPWLPGWGDIIEAAYQRHMVNQDQWVAYARHAFPFTTLIWPDSGLFDIGIDVGPIRLGTALASLRAQFEVKELSAGADLIGHGQGPASAQLIGSAKAKILIQRTQLQFPPSGGLRIHAKWRIQAIGADGSIVADWIEEPPDVEVIEPKK